MAYTILFANDLAEHGQHSGSTTKESTYRESVEAGLNEMTDGGFELVSVGYDEKGEPKTFVLKGPEPRPARILN